MENKNTAHGIQCWGKKRNKINKTRDKFPDRHTDSTIFLVHCSRVSEPKFHICFSAEDHMQWLPVTLHMAL